MASDGSEALWEAWAQGRLCLQGCTTCGRVQHPPGQLCSTCHSDTLGLVDVDNRATLVSWSTVHRAPAAEFAADLPYTVAIVAVDGGALLQARVQAEVATDDFAPDQEVRIELGIVAGRHLPVVSRT